MNEKENIKIYICAHKIIKNAIPIDRDTYVIAAQNKTIQDDRLPILYIDDEFTNRFCHSYGECCLMHYLYTHQDILPDIVGVVQYRRYFFDFYYRTDIIPKYLDNYKLIISEPYPYKQNNFISLGKLHSHTDTKIIDSIIKNNFPKYYSAFQETSNAKTLYGFNMFIMKKENFIELCDYLFGVLNVFNEQLNLNNDADVYLRVFEREKKGEYLWGRLEWQKRLHGFYAELITDSYYRYIGLNNCYVASLIYSRSMNINKGKYFPTFIEV